MKSEFETWPATPVEASLDINELSLRYQPELLLFLTNEAAGVGRPFDKADGQKSVQSFLDWPLTSDIRI